MSRSFATHVLQSQSYDHTRTRTVPVSGLQSSGLFAQELPPSMSMMGNLEISLEVWERTQSQISDQDNITGLSLSDSSLNEGYLYGHISNSRDLMHSLREADSLYDAIDSDPRLTTLISNV
jgi:hypothetical protein